MIVELSNVSPLVDFGFGIYAKSVHVGNVVTIWLSTLYNQNEYDSELYYQEPLIATVTKVSNYEFEISYSEAGTYEISIVVSNKGKSKILTSNTITLTVE